MIRKAARETRLQQQSHYRRRYKSSRAKAFQCRGVLPVGERRSTLKTQRMRRQEKIKKDMTLISPCTSVGNNHSRKGHCPGEPFPLFSNSVGPEMERTRRNFTIDQSSWERRGEQAAKWQIPSLHRVEITAGMWCEIWRTPPHPPHSPTPRGYLHTDCTWYDTIYDPFRGLFQTGLSSFHVSNRNIRNTNICQYITLNITPRS